MRTITKNTIGVDVSKLTFDCYCCETKKYAVFSNTFDGTRELIQWAKNQGSLKHIVFEASGGYENLLQESLDKQELPYWLFDPRRIRYFIQSEGIKAKTDKIDAKLIAQFGAVKKPSYETRKITEEEKQLRALVERRAQLVDMKKAETTRLKKPKYTSSFLEIQEHISYLNQQIKRLEGEIKKISTQVQSLKLEIEILQSVPGVGFVSAASLKSYLPELGHLTKKEISALVGVAPYSKQSGQYRGIERIGGGRDCPRKVLYMCTLVAIQRERVFKERYEMLCRKGKAKKVAIVACMRKMIVILNTLLARKEIWTPC